MKRQNLLIACCLPFGVHGDHDARTMVHLAEPYSGRPVASYTVELPVARQARRAFTIPTDCSEAHEAFAAGAWRWGSRVERRLWPKVDNDCRYALMTQSGVSEPREDYVSDHDFMNSPLEILPVFADCEGGEAGNCLQPGPGFNFLAVKPKLDAGQPCRIENGVFRGFIAYENGKMVCQPDSSAPGFRVVSAYCADINGDERSDVLLRIVPLSKDLPADPLIVPLTRTASDAPFIRTRPAPK